MADFKDLAGEASLAKPVDTGLNLKEEKPVTSQLTQPVATPPVTSPAPEEDIFADLKQPAASVEEDDIFADLKQPLETTAEDDDIFADLTVPKAAEDTSVIEDVATGLQRSVLPMTMTKEELTKEGTWTQFGAQIAGDIASSVAAMKTGAIIGGSVGGPPGAAAGAISGAVLYGIYKGSAEEQALATAEERSFDPLSAALGASVEMIPATPGSRFLRAAMQGVASSADTFYKSENVERAVVAGMLGAGLTGLVAGPNAKPKTIAKAKQMIEEDEELVPQLLLRAHEKFQEVAQEEVPDAVESMFKMNMISKETVEDLLDTDRAFLRHIIQKPQSKLDAGDIAKVKKKITGPDELQRQWEQFKRVDAAERAGMEYADELAQGIEGTVVKDPLHAKGKAETARRKLRDVLFTARRVDETIGTNFEGATNLTAKADRQFKNAMLPFQKRIQKLQRELKGEEREKAAKALRSGDLSNEYAQEMRSIFDDIRTMARQEGYDVGHLDNYFPMQAKDPANLHVALKNQWDMLKSKVDARDANNKDLRDVIEENDQEDFLVAFDFWRKQNGMNLEEPVRAIDINKFVNSPVTYTKKGAAKTPELGIMFERQGEMPEFLREQDPIKALYSYARANIGAIYKRPAHEMLDQQIAMARGAGLDESVLYFENYKRMLAGETGDLLGGMYSGINRFKAAGIFQQQKAKDMVGFDKVYNELAGNTKELVTDIAGWSLSQAYPNLLGYNLYAPIRNTAQTWLMTVPELTQNARLKDIPATESYAHSITAKAWMDTALDKFGKKKMNLEQDLIDRGISGPAHFAEGTEHFMDALHDTLKPLRLSVSVIDEIGKAGMYLYGKSDALNRAITLRISRRLASDLTEGHKIANEIVSGMPLSVRQRIEIGEEQVEDILADYLLSATQFNYGREGLSEFGREYGRAFTMFTKWPAMLASDAEELMRKGGDSAVEKVVKGGAKFGRKHISKLALLYGMDAMFEEPLDTGPGRVLFNKGFAAMAPVHSVTSLPTPLWAQALEMGFGMATEPLDDPGVMLDPEWWQNKAFKAGKTIRPMLPGEFVYRAPERVLKQIEGDKKSLFDRMFD